MAIKKLVNEVADEGFEGLVGETITVVCARYFYTGKLVGVNTECIMLEDPAIVYETGSWNNPKWADAQKLPKKVWYIQKAAIESFGIGK